MSTEMGSSERVTRQHRSMNKRIHVYHTRSPRKGSQRIVSLAVATFITVFILGSFAFFPAREESDPLLVSDPLTPHPVPRFAATTTFASVGGNAPLYYINVTLTNSQSAATSAGMQQKITINPSTYSSYYASDLRNVNWQYGNGTIMKSWLESGASNAATSTTYWVNLGNQIISTGGSLSIFQVIYDTSVNAMDAQTTGANPMYTGTYGEYDNGHNVFDARYYNFSGSSLPSTLTTLKVGAGTFSAIVNNGLTITGQSSSSGTKQAMHVYTSAAGSYQIVEMYLASASLGTTASWELSLATVAPTTSGTDEAGFKTAYRYDWLNGQYRIVRNKNSATGTVLAFNTVALSTPSIQSLLWNATANEAGHYNYIEEVKPTSDSSPITFDNSYIDVTLLTTSTTSYNFAINWLRTRLYPPNGVMPTVSLGSLTSLSIANSIGATQTTIDQTQDSQLTSTISGGFAPYTYQWWQKVPGAASFTSITNANAASYTFTTSTSNPIGEWQFLLQVTDSNATVKNSSPIAIMVNSQLVAPTVTVNYDKIDLGHSVFFSFTGVMNGTPGYTYQWLNSTTGGAGTYVAIPDATDTTYTFNSWATGTWYFALNVTDSADVNLTVTSNAVTVTVNTILLAPAPSANYTLIDQGQNIGLTATAVGTGTSPYSYQWYSQAPGAGSYSIISGATTLSYTFLTNTETLNGTWNFVLNVTDSAGVNVTVTTTAVSVTVNPKLVAPTVTVNYDKIDLGHSVFFSFTGVMNGTPGFTYQWLNSTNLTGPYANIAGETGLTYTFTPWANGIWYFALNVTDSAEKPVWVTSNVVQVTVNLQLVAPTVSANYNIIDLGQSVAISSTAITTGTPDYMFQWLNSSSGEEGTYTAIEYATGMTYMFTPLTTGKGYFALNVTDSAGVPVRVTSNAITITVNTSLVAPTPSANFTFIDQGQNINLTSTALGSGTAPYTYQWWAKAPGAGSYAIIAGATTLSYTYLTNTSTLTGKWSFVLNVTDSAGMNVTVTTVSVNVTIYPQLQSPLFPAELTVNQGATITISNTTSVSGGVWPYTFRWYSKAPGASSYSIIVGANSWTYEFVTTTGTANGTWSLMLNVTDSAGVNVTVLSKAIAVMVNDIPHFSALASDVSYTFGQTGYQLSWMVADNITATTSYLIKRNGTELGTWASWTPGVPITISVDSLGLGWYNYSIVVLDGRGGSNTSWAYVLVNNDVPRISQPSNLTYTYGQTGQVLSWVGTDSANGSSTWILFVNKEQNATGSWTPGFNIVINVTGLWVGVYNYSLLIDDGLSGTNTTWAYVTVLNDIPALNHPYDGFFSVNLATTGNNISWVATDGAYMGATWVLYNNVTGFLQYPTPNATGYWSSGVYINISVDGLSTGTWNWTIFVFDGLGGNCSNQVLINVSSNPAPTITQPPDVVLMIDDQTGYTITWIFTDMVNDTAYAAYWVYRDGENLGTPGDWLGTNIVEIDLASLELPVGMYNFTFIADNGMGMRSQDQCNVTVNDNPAIQHPASMIFNVGTTGNNLTWVVSDAVISGTCTFSCSIDGNLYSTGIWSPSTSFGVNLDGLLAGTHSYLLVIYDGFGGQDTDFGTITVNDIPMISQPMDLTLEYGAMGNNVTWVVSDTISSYRNYSVFVNTIINVTNQPWNPGTSIIIYIPSETGFGTYNYTIFVDDGYNGTARNTVWVTILDDTPVITAPADVSYHYGTPGHVISWTVTDLVSTTRTYTIYIDGVAQAPQNWNSGVAIEIPVDGLDMGTYVYICFVNDGQKNCSDTVIVTVLDDIPEVSIGPVTFTFGTLNNFIVFTISDTYLTTTNYTVYVNGKANVTGIWLPNSPVALNLDHFWVGSFNYSVVVDDGMGETGSVWTIVNVLDDIPQISQPSGIVFFVGASGNVINWTATDQGYNVTSYIVYRNGTGIHNGPWTIGEVISVNFDTLPVGHWNISCMVYDGLGGLNETHVLVIVNTLIPGVANPLIPTVQTRVQRINATFSFVVFDDVTAIGYPPSLTTVSIAFGSPDVFDLKYISLINGTNNGVFNLTIDTRRIPAGTYLLQITFSRQNYTMVQQVVILTVEAYKPVIEIPTGIQSFTEDAEIVITLSVNDIALLNQQFDAIQIDWSVEGTSVSGRINQVSVSGDYFIRFNAALLPPDVNYYLKISIAVNVSDVVYTLDSISDSRLTVNMRVEYATILGIPRPFFWIAIIGILAVLVPVVAYRTVKNARIPPFIKKLTRVRNGVRSQRIGRVTVLTPARDETIEKMRAGDLAAIGVKHPTEAKKERAMPKNIEPKEAS